MNGLLKKLFMVGFFSVLLTSCSFLVNEEKLTIKIAGNEEFETEVDAFNNSFLPSFNEEKSKTVIETIQQDGEPQEVTTILEFVGYFPTEEFSFEKYTYADIWKEKSLIRYLDVKPYAKDNVVTFYPIFIDPDTIPHNYLVVGWYNKESTSGLNQTIMDNVTTALKAYFADLGATQEELNDIVIRGYAGQVGPVGSDVNKDGDVDVMLGMGVNFESTGGVKCVARTSGITMGNKTGRYVDLMSNRTNARIAYDYLISEEGKELFKL